MSEKRNGYIKWALDLAAEDSQYQRMLTEIRVAEKKYNELLSAMPMEEQDIIFDFVSLCEGMSWRLLELVCATKESPSE